MMDYRKEKVIEDIRKFHSQPFEGGLMMHTSQLQGEIVECDNPLFQKSCLCEGYRLWMLDTGRFRGKFFGHNLSHTDTELLASIITAHANKEKYIPLEFDISETFIGYYFIPFQAKVKVGRDEIDFDGYLKIDFIHNSHSYTRLYASLVEKEIPQTYRMSLWKISDIRI